MAHDTVKASSDPLSAWRVFFAVAAGFNFVVALTFLLAPETILAALNVPVQGDLLFHRLTGFLVLCFGIGYAFVARDPQRNRAIVWIGLIGKAGVILLFAQAWLSGTLPFAAFSVSFGDVAFAIGFAAFLIVNRETR